MNVCWGEPSGGGVFSLKPNTFWRVYPQLWRDCVQGLVWCISMPDAGAEGPLFACCELRYPRWCRSPAGLHSSGAQCLREPFASADWEHIRVYRHTGSSRHHQLPARPALQVQLQLPSGVPGQQHAAGLVSLTPIAENLSHASYYFQFISK